MTSSDPAFWLTEIYATPFDLLVPDDREKTVISLLTPDKVIGFQVMVLDDDAKNSDDEGTFFFPAVEPPAPQGPDQFADALLVGMGGSTEEESVVQSDSWGRIKASLSD